MTGRIKGTWALGDVLAGHGPAPWRQVYIVRDAAGRVLYVGTTAVGVGRRLKGHIAGRSPLGLAIREEPAATAGWTVEVRIPPDRFTEERALIARWRPPLNTVGVVAPRPDVSRLPRSRRWLELAALEPRLSALRVRLERLLRRRDRRALCWEAVWYGQGGAKARLSLLVGWDREGHPVLGTEDTYDFVYETLFGLLPYCRHDGLCWG